MNALDFYASLRENLFRDGLRQTQVDTLNLMLAEADQRQTKLGHLAYMMATAYHECGVDMVPKSENLYYTSADRIRMVWPSRFPSSASALPFVRNPIGLANHVYNGRMGNEVGSQDGWTYRGRGFVQLTGKSNYAKATTAFSVDLLAEPDRALEAEIAVDLIFAGMEGGWFTGVSLDDVDDTETYEDDRRVVNGMDRAALVAGYARAFDTALVAGAYAPADAHGDDDLASIRASLLRIERTLEEMRERP